MDTLTDEATAPADVPPGMKWCSTCPPETPGDPPGRIRFITDFYFASGHNADGTRRRMHWCKECHKRYSRDNRLNRLALGGEAYRDDENLRIRNYMSQESAAEARRAAERAKQAALRALRARHQDEYKRLLKAARINEGLSAK